MSKLNVQLRKDKTEFKNLREVQRELNNVIKNQHEAIMRMEDRCKKIT